MRPVYISGHQNPDTDSIIAAIAYGALKKQLGETHYIPSRLGEVSAESQFVLDRYNLPEPKLLKSVKTQIEDVDYDMPYPIEEDLPIRNAWESMRSKETSSLPVVNGKGALTGLISISNIARSDIEMVYDEEIIHTTVKNLLDTLSGTLLCGTLGEVNGKIKIAKDKYHLNREGAIVLAEYEEGIEQEAAKSSAACVILCHGEKASSVKEEIATKTIACPFGIYKASRMVYHSTPIKNIMRSDGLVTFHLADYLDEVKEVIINTRYRNFPVLNSEGTVVGMISRNHLMNYKQKNVVLVDHNEKGQSIPGLEQATILEIIDHHRLGDIQTAQPLSIRSEPVGSSNTIIAGMFRENGITPSKEVAGAMLCAILSDTVLFKSPTCTPKDKEIANYLAGLAGENIEQLGNDLFTAGSTLLDEGPEAIIYRDFKEFGIGGCKVGIGQVTCWDVEMIQPMQQQIKDMLEEIVHTKGFDLVLLMETSIKEEGTLLLCAGKVEKVIEKAFGQPPKNGELYLPGVMSRKKQIVPQVTLNL